MVGAPLAALDNPVDIVVLLVFAFLLFGKQLPEVARSLGKGIRELKESTNFSEVTDALKRRERGSEAWSRRRRSCARRFRESRSCRDTVGAAKRSREPVSPFPAATDAGTAGAGRGESGSRSRPPPRPRRLRRWRRRAPAPVAAPAPAEPLEPACGSGRPRRPRPADSSGTRAFSDPGVARRRAAGRFRCATGPLLWRGDNGGLPVGRMGMMSS